ncbi:MAG: hypothetical protein WC732_05110 [Candidatus Omnitrophota bacterium]
MCRLFPVLPVLYVISGVSLVIGLFLYLKPRDAIRIQIAFYKSINWRMEPVSMEKEVRSTRWMGLFLMLASLASVITILMKTRI